jgi:hypothetical protein
MYIRECGKSHSSSHLLVSFFVLHIAGTGLFPTHSIGDRAWL